MMLSQLDWNLLSFHGKCATPDDFDPCPIRSHSSFVSTTTRSNTNTSKKSSSKQNLFTEIDELPQTITAQPVLHYDIMLIMLIALAGIVGVIIGFVCFVIFCRCSKKEKKSPHSSEPIIPTERSSRADSIIEEESVEEISNALQLQQIPIFKSRSSISNEETTRPKHVIGETPTSSNSNVSVHHYEKLVFPCSNVSDQQNRTAQDLQRRNPSSDVTRYVGIYPRSFKTTPKFH